MGGLLPKTRTIPHQNPFSYIITYPASLMPSSALCWLQASHSSHHSPAGCGHNYTKGENGAYQVGKLLIGVFSFLFYYMHTHTYIYMLVKNCYPFIHIFAWRPHNFDVIIIWRERVIFPFQEGSYLPWQTSVF